LYLGVVDLAESLKAVCGQASVERPSLKTHGRSYRTPANGILISRCVAYRERRTRTEGKEIVTPLVEPTDLELIRKIAAAGGRKYTAGNLDRGKYQRLVALGWLTEVSVNISDVVYEVTEAGKAAALRDD
jgi:hypothetical protein